MDRQQATGQRFQALCDQVARFTSVAVAFSGGVDSSLLLAAARVVHGDRVLALHARSPLQAAGEFRHALQVAADLGCHPVVLELDPYAWPEVTANSAQRCYYCKRRMYRLFLARAAAAGHRALLDGTNLDDLGKDRPGLAAIRELAVKTPLAEAGLGKQEIRALARRHRLRNWNRPAASCLATRIMGQQPITPDRIAVVARGEDFLRQHNFSDCRFRHFGDYCQVEIPAVAESRLAHKDIWRGIEVFCRKLGFTAVERGVRPQE